MSPSPRRAWLRRLASVAALGLALPMLASAQESWPSREIHLVVPWPAGGETDRYARALAVDLAERLGKPVVVENRAGATGSIGISQVVRSKPDGYTFLFANTTAVVGNVVSSPVPVPFDPITDLEAVALTVESAYVLWANPKLEIKSVDDLVKRARDGSQERLAFGITGPGSLSELSVEQLARHYKLDLIKVPYKGSAPQLADLVAGHTHIGTADPSVALPHFEAGKLVPLLVIGNDRLAELPGVPALKELAISGPDLTIWNGVFAPVGVPREVIEAFTKAIGESVKSQTYRQAADGPGRRAIFEAGDAAGARVKRELEERKAYKAQVEAAG